MTILYTGIDHHKRYSVACTLDEKGNLSKEGRIAGNAPETFASYFEQLGTPSAVVIKVRWNWGVMYDRRHVQLTNLR